MRTVPAFIYLSQHPRLLSRGPQSYAGVNGHGGRGAMQGEQEQRAPSLHVGKCDVGKDAARSQSALRLFAICCSVAPRPCHVGETSVAMFAQLGVVKNGESGTQKQQKRNVFGPHIKTV